MCIMYSPAVFSNSCLQPQSACLVMRSTGKVIQQTIKNLMYSSATGNENNMKRDYRPKPFEICSKRGLLICIYIHFIIILTVLHCP